MREVDQLTLTNAPYRDIVEAMEYYRSLQVDVPDIMTKRAGITRHLKALFAITFCIPPLILAGLLMAAVANKLPYEAVIVCTCIYLIGVSAAYTDGAWMDIWLDARQKANRDLTERLHAACVRHNSILQIMSNARLYMMAIHCEDMDVHMEEMGQRMSVNAEKLRGHLLVYNQLELPIDAMSQYKEVVRAQLGVPVKDVASDSLKSLQNDVLQTSADLEMLELDARTIISSKVGIS